MCTIEDMKYGSLTSILNKKNSPESLILGSSLRVHL